MSEASGERSTKHHYVPASYIGRFSSTSKSRYRQRLVWVRRAGVANAFPAKAEERAHQIGLYDLPTRNAILLDHIDRWPYESSLPAALTSMAVESPDSLDISQWIYTIVPFVAAALVRGPDANNGDNNEGRFIEFQELLAPVLSAVWTVMHFGDVAELITNDRGLASMNFNGQPTLLVPLDRRTALILVARDFQVIRRSKTGEWISPIRHIDGSKDDLAQAREAVARSALHEVYGASENAVEGLEHALIERKHPRPRDVLLPYDVDLRAHFYDYFRIRSAVNSDMGSEQAAADAASWTSLQLDPETPIAVELLFPERTRGGVYAGKDKIVLKLELGKVLKEIRVLYGDVRAGFVAVSTAGHLANESAIDGLGYQWRKGQGVDMGYTSVTLATASSITHRVNIARIWEDNRPKWHSLRSTDQ